MLIHPNVAGKFYPNDPEQLKKMLTKMLENAKDKSHLPTPKAIIAPHAGYIYSGPIAASAYSCLTQASATIKKVVVLAPAHQYPVAGIATTNAKHYLTPLGKIEIDQKTIAKIDPSFVQITQEAFELEHSLEVQLPFLQIVLGDFLLIPLIVGHTSPEKVAKVLEKLWDEPDTLIVVSSDLSHHHPYDVAKKIDQKTASAIIGLDIENFDPKDACGSIAIKGLLIAAARKNLQATLIDLRSSGDTLGSKDSVVGYGAFHVT